MANHVYNISETRSLPALIDTASIVNLLQNYLVSHGYRVKDVSQSSLRATKQGLHVNFKPKMNITIQHDLQNNATVIQIRSLASIKIVTGFVVGFITSGASTAVGIALYAHHARTASKFVHRIFDQLQQIMAAPQTLLYRKGYGGRSAAARVPRATVVMQQYQQPQILGMGAPGVPVVAQTHHTQVTPGSITA